MTERLRRVPLHKWVDPAEVYRALSSDEPRSIWLDAGPDATTGLSYISLPTSQVLKENVTHGEVTIFERLRSELAGDFVWDTTVAAENGFALGWVGWLGYELASHTAGVPTADSLTPDAYFVYLDWALEFDHSRQVVDLLYLGNEEQALQKCVEIQHLIAQPKPHKEADISSDRSVVWRHQPDRYKQMVQECLDAITAGDAYQLCLTNQALVSGTFNPTQVYLSLRQENPSHHGGILVFEDVALLSSSPEVFLTVDTAGKITTKPIKGTRKRGHNSDDDAALAEELVTSEKERAENLMIVDLMRNDIGKVAQLGTVTVEELLTVESYENVHQLVSTVTAQLSPGMTAIDALEASFPAGSMTGAPKISAMTLLHHLEQGPRGIYSGAFGYLGIDGAANFAMVIRSIVLTDQGAMIGTGGGITSGSIPDAELEETRIKIAPLLKALGVDSNRYS